jgi:H+/gluconate symporter-like permease
MTSSTGPSGACGCSAASNQRLCRHRTACLAGAQSIAAGVNPELLHRIAAIGACTMDSLPHNGAVVTLLAVCRSSHRESYFHIAMTAIVGPIVALAAVIVLAGMFGSF